VPVQRPRSPRSSPRPCVPGRRQPRPRRVARDPRHGDDPRGPCGPPPTRRRRAATTSPPTRPRASRPAPAWARA
jgi:hypothetical protein